MRVLAKPTGIGGHTLPAGAVTMLPIPVLHRDPRAFAEPDAFRPERFLGAGEDPAAFFPFGGGAHRCLGEPLAHAEIATVV
ncbi:cytochrome P450, partial [Escherichia coli]